MPANDEDVPRSLGSSWQQCTRTGTGHRRVCGERACRSRCRMPARVRGPRAKVPGHTFPHGWPRASLRETHPTAALPGEAA